MGNDEIEKGVNAALKGHSLRGDPVCATCRYFVPMYDEGRGQCRYERKSQDSMAGLGGIGGPWEWVQKPDREFCRNHPDWVD